MNFDMNRTWTHALTLLAANWQLLAVIAGVFILLPGTLFYVALPDFATELTAQTNPDPERVLAMLRAVAVPLAVLLLVMIVAQTIGNLAMIALIGDDRPTVGEALRRALAYLPSAIGVALLQMVLFMAVAIIGMVIMGVLIAAATAIGSEVLAAVLGTLAVIAILVAFVALSCRLVLANPIIALEGVTGPVTVLKRSWALTRNNGLKIFVFFLLLGAAYLVISMVLGSVFGLIAGLFGGGSASALVLGLSNGAVAAAVAMLSSAILVAMFRQLAGVSGQTIDQTFG